MSGCLSLRGEGTVCLGVCHSWVRGPFLGACHSSVRGPCMWVVSLRGEGTMCLGVCHSEVKGPCVWVFVTQG